MICFKENALAIFPEQFALHLYFKFKSEDFVCVSVSMHFSNTYFERLDFVKSNDLFGSDLFVSFVSKLF